MKKSLAFALVSMTSIAVFALVAMTSIAVFAAFGDNDAAGANTNQMQTNASSNRESNFNVNFEINVISREAGSGTRGAFIELMGILVDGMDMTNPHADIANGTNIVIASVANNLYGIGYISMSSVGSNVRGLSIDGIEPTAENVLNGSYAVMRPFLITVQNNDNPLRDDFIEYILSAEGQEIVAASYVPMGTDRPAFTGGNLSGTLVVSGSTSVYPVMSRLAEAYSDLTGVTVEVHSMGSSAGITQAIDGTVDIGMSSRDLNADELAQVNAIAIAYDGLAVIVHPGNPLTSITSEEVRRIFVGELTRWNTVID